MLLRVIGVSDIKTFPIDIGYPLIGKTNSHADGMSVAMTRLLRCGAKTPLLHMLSSMFAFLLNYLHRKDGSQSFH